MSYEQEGDFCKIINVNKFYNYIKEESIGVFLLKFDKYFDSSQFLINLEEYESFIQEDVFDFECERFIKFDDDNNMFIRTEDIDHLISSLSNEMVSFILNHLVDIGILEMCWDNERDSFVWKLSKKYLKDDKKDI